MPVYEYACRDCGHRFDTRQSIRDEPLTICPTCKGAIRRVIQPVGIVFKGSGFYKTDSRGSSEAAASSTERKSDAAATPSTESSGTTAASASTAAGTAPSSGTSTPAATSAAGS